MDTATATTTQSAPDTLLSGGQSSQQPASQQTAPPPQASWSWADESGKFSPGWLEKAGYKDDPTLSTIGDIPTLAKGYKEARSLIGKKMAPPGENSTPEEVAKWLEALGIPGEIDAFGDLMPEGFNKDLWDVNLEKGVKELALKHHGVASPAFLKDLSALHTQKLQGMYEREVQNVNAAIERGRQELREAWGQDFETKAAAAKLMAARLGIPETDDIFRTRPDILKALAEAAPHLLGGDKIVHGMPQTMTGGIQSQIDSIQRGDDYQGKNGPQRQREAQAQLHKLLETKTRAMSQAA